MTQVIVVTGDGGRRGKLVPREIRYAGIDIRSPVGMHVRVLGRSNPHFAPLRRLRIPGRGGKARRRERRLGPHAQAESAAKMLRRPAPPIEADSFLAGQHGHVLTPIFDYVVGHRVSPARLAWIVWSPHPFGVHIEDRPCRLSLLWPAARSQAWRTFQSVGTFSSCFTTFIGTS